MRDDRDDGWVVLEGDRYELVRYGSETIFGVPTYSTPCHICGVAPGEIHRLGCAMVGGYPPPAARSLP